MSSRLLRIWGMIVLISVFFFVACEATFPNAVADTDLPITDYIEVQS